MKYLFIHIYTHLHICIDTFRWQKKAGKWSSKEPSDAIYRYKHKYIHIIIRTYTYIYTHIYRHIFLHTYMQTYFYFAHLEVAKKGSKMERRRAVGRNGRNICSQVQQRHTTLEVPSPCCPMQRGHTCQQKRKRARASARAQKSERVCESKRARVCKREG